MKKSIQLTIQIALFLWLFTPSTLFAQVLTTENFSGTSVGALTTVASAAPWRYQVGTHTCTNSSSPYQYWEVGNGSWGGYSASGFSGNFAVCDGRTSCTHDAYLVACRFTVPAGITSVKITYKHYYDDYSSTDAGYVYVYDRTASAFLNGGSSYKSYTSDQGSFSSPVSDGFMLTGLTPGSTYDVRFRYTSSNDWYWLVDDLVATGIPENCTNAITLTPGAAGAACTTTSGITGTTQSQAGCVGTADDDVWYSFTATATSHTVTFSNVTGTPDIVHQIFSGTCGALTSLACTDTPDNTTVTGLTIGNTYYVRVYTYASSGTASFNVCVTTPPAPPANDNCSGAITLTPATTCTNTAGTTTGATQSQAGCVGTADDDVWYKFTATATSHTVTFSSVTGTTDIVHQVFSGTCGALTSLVCTDTPDNSTVTGLTIGNTYYIRVYTYFSGSASFNVCVTTPPTYGSPDCSTPSKLCTDGSILTFGTNATGNTPGGNNYSCLGSTPRPNWFYVQVENPGDLIITVNGYNTSNSLVDIDFAVWGPYANLAAAQAACGTLPAPVDCNFSASATEIMNIPVSTTGQVYMILITGYSPSSDHFTLQQTGGSGTTSCNGVTGACDISNVTLASISACNGNSTTIATDDYYTADITVTFANKPATGNLELVGTGIHSGTYSVAVGSAGTTTYTFTGVKIKADGSSQSITAQFSAQTGCNFIKSGITAVASCSCAAGTMNMTITSP